jgi:hypothetical protein
LQLCDGCCEIILKESVQDNHGRDNSKDEAANKGKRSLRRIFSFLMHLLHHGGFFRDNFDHFQGSGVGFYGDHGN